MRTSGVVALLPLVLCSCSPWTIRQIEENDRAKLAGQSGASPAAYVDSIWASKLEPAMLSSAIDARTLLDAIAASPDEAGGKYGHREGGGTWYFTIKGEGRALTVDTHSRNGLLLVDIAPFDRRADVSIQIGPVLRGTALRDATGIIRFTDFVNQLQFADVGNELNNRCLQMVLKGLDVKSLSGRTIRFAGAFALESVADPPVSGIVPVQLVAEEGR